MNDSGNPVDDDIYAKESPLPGSERPFLRPDAAVIASSNAFSIHIFTDLVLPFFLTHLIYWPVLLIGFAPVFVSGKPVDLIWLQFVIATLASIIGGAGYGWHIGRRFTELTYIAPESNGKGAINRGRRNQIVMSVFQAILFPSLFWGGCAVFVGITSGPPAPSIVVGQLHVVCCNSMVIDQPEMIVCFK